jgi:sulfhydrogenase subunit beta (sulfur reductase)
MYFLEPESLDSVILTLRDQGYTVVGPTLRDGAIVYDELLSAGALPVGWTDEQEAKHYRVHRRNDQAIFGYNVGPHSLKRFLFPSALKIFSAHRAGKGFEVKTDGQRHNPQYAFLGVRACELAALVIHDKVFSKGLYVDPYYKALRDEAFIIAVNCSQAGGTCFCTSMNTGPRATGGFDIALTEVLDGQAHFLAAEVGSEKGELLLANIPHRSLEEDEVEQVNLVIERARQQVKKTLDTSNLKERLYANFDHTRWNEVAKRCLSCANCTLVCPTCFCTTIEDVTELTGEHAERWRKWDSCFTMDFTYIHGGSIRQSIRSRYRQWMTHKLASWIDQFGTSGCVGCGRCITWCPVGIDITEEAAAISVGKKTEQFVTTG